MSHWIKGYLTWLDLSPTYVPNFIEIVGKKFEGHISVFFQVQGHVTQKLGEISKIRPEKNLDIVL